MKTPNGPSLTFTPHAVPCTVAFVGYTIFTGGSGVASRRFLVASSHSLADCPRIEPYISLIQTEVQRPMEEPWARASI